MSDLEHRLKHDLEPVLALDDPRTRISAYHDMPYALFRYEPEEEFQLRISLAECLDEAMRLQRSLEEWFAAERE